jgi:uncharacterized protein
VISSFTLDSAYNRISAVLVTPDAGNGPYPAAVLSHGLISSKTSSKYVTLSERLAAMGIASCRFDYHGCGESGGDLKDTTLTIRLDNLDRIVEDLISRKEIDPRRIGIIGASFGAATLIVKASRDPRIKCISPWATPYIIEKPESAEIDGIAFSDDLYADFARYDILEAARNASHALLIHGDADEVVPCHEGKTIYENLKEPKRLVIIEGGDHILSDPGHREQAISLALDWFGTYLLS